MSNIDKQTDSVSRIIADLKLKHGSGDTCAPIMRWHELLALLDELEAAEKRIAELEAVKCKLSDSKLLSLAKDVVENLVDTGGSDPEYTQQYVDWTLKRIRAAAGKGEAS
ncbi:hypothetical protein P842_01974 [Enterobacter roggenkampii UCI 39]|uniref:hypothetical protein n=1 Tax=Enterobacter roggenkampii TaxID=1812935 RepID=UPI000451E873|nr:hypothetical protein [Enterobacter roggenkampii]EKY3989817.1 hypothetical protein [Enterobacter roggenkampii]EUL60797.1 hypothetical protein P842_01974 [Enterobacter roggenkampii UCI 39]MDL0009747.1 hypothetical protein [Enterobacter roggenkampii]MED5761402.1 hypothetical protein [Enterobacter roggenkampii]